MSDSNDAFEYRDQGLAALIEAFKNTKERARVGILGGGAVRAGANGKEEETNASIGLKHEMTGVGKSKTTRSFLRVPIIDNMQKALLKSGIFSEDVIKKIIADKSVIPVLKIIAINAENIVQEGFDTEGYGKWAPWAPGYESRTGKILQDTRQLKKSITWDVV